MEYPHWLMVAGAVLVAFGFVGFAFRGGISDIPQPPLGATTPIFDPDLARARRSFTSPSARTPDAEPAAPSLRRPAVTKLYGAGRLFACRHCYRLAYASQQESAHQRGLAKSQKIRMRLGGSVRMLDEFPDKPKGMHWRTYEHWRRLHDAAEERSNIGLMGFVERLGRRTSRRA